MGTTSKPELVGRSSTVSGVCVPESTTDPGLGPGGVPAFYPLYTTTFASGSCMWQQGGANIPGTHDTFGGSSTTEYGGLLLSNYPAAGFTITQRYNNFQNVLGGNACPAAGGK